MKKEKDLWRLLVNNIHATLISFQNAGILFIGKSGSGKSDVALRLIMEHGAVLVADDRVNLEIIDKNLYGSAPENIAGKMEVRNLGVLPFNSKKREKISLCVELCTDRIFLERLPKKEYVKFLGVPVEKIKLHPFDCSTICKIILKITSIIR